MTPKQYKLLTFIRNQIVHFSKASTFSEMKEFMEVTSNQTIGDWLSILERDGYISRKKGKLRGIFITQRGKSGFDENLQLQNPEAIKKSFVPAYNNMTSSLGVFNTPQNLFDKGINVNAKDVIPEWEGGEKSGSS